MQTWPSGTAGPWQGILAADMRVPFPADPGWLEGDLSWEMRLGGGEPSAIHVSSTLGLRAVNASFFPVFHRLGKTRLNPAEFHSPPALDRIYPSWFSLRCEPFEGVQAILSYRAAGSHLLLGRIALSNKTVLPQHLRLDWAGVFAPHGGGESLAVLPLGRGHALAAQSGNLELVVCVTGSAVPGSLPWPSLSISEELYPAAELVVSWAVAALPRREDAFLLAQAGLDLPWEAGLARIELTAQADDLHIHTGDEQWDAVLALAQKAGHDLVMPASGQLPHPAPLLARQPDLGNLSRGDGADLPPLWRGATPLDCLHLSGLLLPSSPKLVQGWVENFLHTQDPSGRVDLRPSPGGQQARLPNQPLLSELALRASPLPSAGPWLAGVYPALLANLRSWLSQGAEIGDCALPRWQSPLQTQLESHPLFDRWHARSLGMDIRWLESPALGSMLVNECQRLGEIARRIAQTGDLPWLEEQAASLRRVVEAAWERKSGLYLYRDCATQRTPTARLLAEMSGSGQKTLNRTLRIPQRLVLQLDLRQEGTRPVRAEISGRGTAGQPLREVFEPSSFAWAPGHARATSQACFQQVEEVMVNGLSPGEGVRLVAAGLNVADISLLLPLWAGIPSAHRAGTLLSRLFATAEEDSSAEGNGMRWLERFGITTYPAGSPEEAIVELPWNQLLIEGMLRYGFVSEAADSYSRLIAAVAGNLRREKQFRRRYAAQSGLGQGELGHLWGIPSPDLFLRIAGIQPLSAREWIISGKNPFPWPITVQYQQTTLIREGDLTKIRFPGREEQTITGTEPLRISCPSP